jgi:hypothetical protein
MTNSGISLDVSSILNTPDFHTNASPDMVFIEKRSYVSKPDSISGFPMNTLRGSKISS